MVNPFHLLPYAFSCRDAALTVRISSTPGREQAAELPEVLERPGQVGQDRPEGDHVEAALGDLRDLVGNAEVGLTPGEPPVGLGHRVRRQVDAERVEPALLGQLQEEPGPAPEVQQPPPPLPVVAVVEHGAEGVHGQPVAALAAGGVVPGEEAAVVVGVEVAQTLGPDVGVAVEEAARRAAHHPVAPLPLAVGGREERLLARVTAHMAGDELLDLPEIRLFPVIVQCDHRSAAEPHLPLDFPGQPLARADVDPLSPGDLVVAGAVHDARDHLFRGDH
nr:hypothetical protein GCM10020093_035410 [Planobispora longispora]